MSVVIVVGGQYGSEGKGKVVLDFAKRIDADIAVRVGGRNSGHTVYKNGMKYIFKVLPSAVIKGDVMAVLPSGAYFNVQELFDEKKMSGLNDDKLIIDPYSVIIDEDCVKKEEEGKLSAFIGSTASGTGEAVMRRIARDGSVKFAKDVCELKPFIQNTKAYLRDAVSKNKNIIIEGTQGFGLSLLHSSQYPYVTSRDTTAASVISEVGLSPFDVTDIIMVIRAFPIRVAGNSGNLENEINWKEVEAFSGTDKSIVEYTSVTNKIRRVARFDKDIVKQALVVNNPSILVLNHTDYVDDKMYCSSVPTDKVNNFIKNIEKDIDRKIDYIGSDPFCCHKI